MIAVSRPRAYAKSVPLDNRIGATPQRLTCKSLALADGYVLLGCTPLRRETLWMLSPTLLGGVEKRGLQWHTTLLVILSLLLWLWLCSLTVGAPVWISSRVPRLSAPPRVIGHTCPTSTWRAVQLACVLSARVPPSSGGQLTIAR